MRTKAHRYSVLLAAQPAITAGQPLVAITGDFDGGAVLVTAKASITFTGTMTAVQTRIEVDGVAQSVSTVLHGIPTASPVTLISPVAIARVSNGRHRIAFTLTVATGATAITPSAAEMDVAEMAA